MVTYPTPINKFVSLSLVIRWFVNMDDGAGAQLWLILILFTRFYRYVLQVSLNNFTDVLCLFPVLCGSCSEIIRSFLLKKKIGRCVNNIWNWYIFYPAKRKTMCTRTSGFIPILILICSFKGPYFCSQEQNTELIYLVWCKFYHFSNLKLLRFSHKNCVSVQAKIP